MLAAAGLDADLYAPDPWAADVARGLALDNAVLAIGTGLTMVDVALQLERSASGAKLTALPRRGLRPRPHGENATAAPLAERPPLGATALLDAVGASPCGRLARGGG